MTLTLTLGDFTFARFEIPESIPFGASQKLNVHTLVGGARVIDALGKVPVNPGWSGWLIGENALGRARYLKGVAEAGKPHKLTWSELAFTVVVSSFTADFKRVNRLPYQIAFEVVSDDTAPTTAAPPPSIEQLVGDDLDAAMGLASGIGDGTLSGLLAGVQSAVKAVGSVATASLSAIHTILQPIAAAQAQVSALLGTTATNIANLGNLASLGGLSPNSVSQFAGSLALGVNATSQSSAMIGISRTLGRMQVNLSALNSGTKSVVASGTDLFHIAADQYGDAMAWTQLAQGNGLIDPTLAQITTLTVPPVPSVINGVVNA